jgi:hypothetical protein
MVPRAPGKGISVTNEKQAKRTTDHLRGVVECKNVMAETGYKFQNK